MGNRRHLLVACIETVTIAGLVAICFETLLNMSIFVIDADTDACDTCTKMFEFMQNFTDTSQTIFRRKDWVNTKDAVTGRKSCINQLFQLRKLPFVSMDIRFKCGTAQACTGCMNNESGSTVM